MQRPTIVLQNPDGSHHRLICNAEATELLSTRRAKRIKKANNVRTILRLIPVPEPSNSENSKACLTRADIKFLSEYHPKMLAMELPAEVDKQIARLMGWGLIPHNEGFARL